MSIERQDLVDYLDRYAQTLTDLDAPAATALWSMPAVIADSNFTGVIETRELMRDGLSRSYPLYQQLGLDSVGYELIDASNLTESLVLAHVQWQFLEKSGALLTDSTAYYLIREEAGGLLASVCIQIDDAEKLQALATRLGVDLTSPSA